MGHPLKIYPICLQKTQEAYYDVSKIYTKSKQKLSVHHLLFWVVPSTSAENGEMLVMYGIIFCFPLWQNPSCKALGRWKFILWLAEQFYIHSLGSFLIRLCTDHAYVRDTRTQMIHFTVSISWIVNTSIIINFAYVRHGGQWYTMTNAISMLFI